MKNYLYIGFIAVALMLNACGGGKTNDPAPSTNDTGATGNTGNTGNTGGTGGTGSGGGYTTKATANLNTISALVDYDVKTSTVLDMTSTNANMGGITTIKGSTTTIALMGVKDNEYTITNLGDAIDMHFKVGADPYFFVSVTDAAAKTITTTEVHFNKGSSGQCDLTLQGNLNDFKGVTVTAKDMQDKIASTLQAIQKLSLR